MKTPSDGPRECVKATISRIRDRDPGLKEWELYEACKRQIAASGHAEYEKSIKLLIEELEL